MSRNTTQHNIAHMLTEFCTKEEMMEYANMYMHMYRDYGLNIFCETVDLILSHIVEMDGECDIVAE